MKCAYEERCILELTRSIRSESLQSQAQALVKAQKQYQEIIQKIESKIDYALSHDRNYFFLDKNTPRSIFKMLNKMGYKISSPYEARLNFDNETIKVSF